MLQTDTSLFREKGAAMVEFALVLPLLLIVMIGILEVSLFFMQDNTLNKAVRESSRYLSKNLGIDGCHYNVARQIVIGNMNITDQFNYDVNPNGDINFRFFQSCVNETDGSIVSETEVDPSVTSCAVASVACTAGNHLHVRVQATYTASMLTGGLVFSNMGINFSPTLSANSIMRVQ